MKKIFAIAIAFFTCTVLMAVSAHAQQVDVAFGVSNVLAPSSNYTSSSTVTQSIGGGAFPGFSADALIHHRFGIQGEIYWRGSQNTYEGYQPFRPIFFDVNGMWLPKINRRVTGELLAGIGAETVRFYNNTYSCNYFSCTDYSSENKFIGHFGVGVRLYAWKNLFIRPEAAVYLIPSNDYFNSNYATRVGASIGYSFGGR